ncbi:MAG: lamin tail domain-containing protein [Phycisphaeraceae bacterium]
MRSKQPLTPARENLSLTLALSALLLTLCSAHAPARVIISEIWPGGLPGEEASSDWIEVTNLGTQTITNLDQWHIRDVPVPPSVPDGLWLAGGQLTGVPTLAPGESTVFLMSWDDVILDNLNPTLEQAIAAFHTLWGTANSDLKLGYALDINGGGGPGLSRDGDTVILYDASLTGANIVDTQSFPVANRASYIYNPAADTFGDLAVPGRFGAYNSLTAGSTDSDLPAIASPGAIPEPATAGLLALLLALTARRHPKEA